MHLSQFRASYVFWRYKKTPKRTAYLMAVRCWSRLDSTSAVPVLRPAQNPCNTSWNMMADMSQRFRRLATNFQRTLTSTIPLKYLLTFGIRKTICHMYSLASVLSQNTDFMMAKRFFQLVESGETSRVAAIRHWRRCSALIPDRTPKRFRRSLRTTQEIYSSSGMASSTRKGRSPTDIGSLGGGT